MGQQNPSIGAAAEEFPVGDLRADTPGTAEVVHLNNAGSALPARPVLDVVIDHLELEARIGGYEAAAAASDRLVAVYGSLAALIGAGSGQIALVESATRAWDMAVYGYPFQPGDRVLTSRAEYASNAIALLQLRVHKGIEIVLIDDDDDGQISLEHLDRELAAGAAMLSLTHIPTGGGLVNPAEDVGRVCRDHGTFYVLDACQSVGHKPIDVASVGCDVLSATGRKYLRAPRGTGFLYVGERAMEVLEPPLLDLHSATWTAADRYELRGDARRFEAFESSIAGRLGLGAACDYALELGVARSWERIVGLASRLRQSLRAVDGVEVRDKGLVRGGIVTFTVEGLSATEVSDRLRVAGINTSVTARSSAVLDLPDRGLDDLVRASVHYYNTESEIDRLAAAVAAMASPPQ